MIKVCYYREEAGVEDYREFKDFMEIYEWLLRCRLLDNKIKILHAEKDGEHMSGDALLLNMTLIYNSENHKYKIRSLNQAYAKARNAFDEYCMNVHNILNDKPLPVESE